MKTIRFLWLMTGFLVAGLTPASEAQVRNLIINGSFESPGFADNVFELTPGSTIVTGWVAGERGADWISSRFPDPSWRPPDGDYFMDLSSIYDDPPKGPDGGSISQVITTTPGFTYRLSFQMAGENANVPAPALLSVTVGSSSYSFSLPTTPAVTWVQQTLLFTAESDATLINFTDVKASPDGNSNVLLDAVSVVAVPEANTIERLVPCAGPRSGGTWKSHGQYVSALVETAKTLLLEGLISDDESRAAVVAAARSDCGRK